HGFGCLQGSVWITPDSLVREREILAGAAVNPASLTLLEGRPCGEESDSDLVLTAWDFRSINARYDDCLAVLEQFPTVSLNDRGGPAALQHWARRERLAWLSAVALDPLLPEQLLPTGY